MKTTLIVGIETLSGRYLADSFSLTHRVLGVSLSGKQTSVKCDLRSMSQISESAARLFLEADDVDQVIYCGDAAQSSWEPDVHESQFCSDSSQVVVWSRACDTSSTPFVFLSSDCIFDGPWMFHAEESESFSGTPRSHSIRSQEEIVSHNENALIVRSHLVGFAPRSFLTQSHFSTESPPQFSFIKHATPIYAGRFAQLLKEVLHSNPKGIIHLGGGERTSRQIFLSQLAERFGGTVHSSSREEFGTATYCETALRSTRAKDLISSGLPDIEDLLDEIAADLESDAAKRFAEIPHRSRSKVA